MESKTNQKIEEKCKYYFSKEISINIEIFEEILQNYSKISNETPAKNGHKLYGIHNKFFKIFQDGSCYGFTIINNMLTEIDGFYEHKQTNQQIFNDDFAGLKTYWVEEIYEEIIYKLEDDAQIVFAKMTDVPRNITEYSIYIEIKNKSCSIQQIKKKYDNNIQIISSSLNSS